MIEKTLNTDYTTDTPYIYVFIRRDIPIVQQIIQSSHACHHAGHYFGAPDGCHLILFAVNDKDHLVKVANQLSGIEYHMFYEPDPIWGRDEETPMGCSALCTRPMVGEERRVMESYDLWMEN